MKFNKTLSFAVAAVLGTGSAGLYAAGMDFDGGSQGFPYSYAIEKLNPAGEAAAFNFPSSDTLLHSISNGSGLVLQPGQIIHIRYDLSGFVLPKELKDNLGVAVTPASYITKLYGPKQGSCFDVCVDAAAGTNDTVDEEISSALYSLGFVVNPSPGATFLAFSIQNKSTTDKLTLGGIGFKLAGTLYQPVASTTNSMALRFRSWMDGNSGVCAANGLDGNAECDFILRRDTGAKTVIDLKSAMDIRIEKNTAIAEINTSYLKFSDGKNGAPFNTAKLGSVKLAATQNVRGTDGVILTHLRTIVDMKSSISVAGNFSAAGADRLAKVRLVPQVPGLSLGCSTYAGQFSASISADAQSATFSDVWYLDTTPSTRGANPTAPATPLEYFVCYTVDEKTPIDPSNYTLTYNPVLAKGTASSTSKPVGPVIRNGVILQATFSTSFNYQVSRFILTNRSSSAKEIVSVKLIRNNPDGSINGTVDASVPDSKKSIPAGGRSAIQYNEIVPAADSSIDMSKFVGVVEFLVKANTGEIEGAYQYMMNGSSVQTATQMVEPPSLLGGAGTNLAAPPPVVGTTGCDNYVSFVQELFNPESTPQLQFPAGDSASDVAVSPGLNLQPGETLYVRYDFDGFKFGSTDLPVAADITNFFDHTLSGAASGNSQVEFYIAPTDGGTAAVFSIKNNAPTNGGSVTVANLVFKPNGNVASLAAAAPANQHKYVATARDGFVTYRAWFGAVASSCASNPALAETASCKTNQFGDAKRDQVFSTASGFYFGNYAPNYLIGDYTSASPYTRTAAVVSEYKEFVSASQAESGNKYKATLSQLALGVSGAYVCPAVSPAPVVSKPLYKLTYDANAKPVAGQTLTNLADILADTTSLTVKANTGDFSAVGDKKATNVYLASASDCTGSKIPGTVSTDFTTATFPTYFAKLGGNDPRVVTGNIPYYLCYESDGGISAIPAATYSATLNYVPKTGAVITGDRTANAGEVRRDGMSLQATFTAVANRQVSRFIFANRGSTDVSVTKVRIMTLDGSRVLTPGVDTPEADVSKFVIRKNSRMALQYSQILPADSLSAPTAIEFELGAEPGNVEGTYQYMMVGSDVQTVVQMVSPQLRRTIK